MKSTGLDSLPEDQFLHGRKGPWPQPQPAHPLGEAMGVVHVPFGEWVDWWANIGARYMVTLLTVPYEFALSLFRPGLATVTEQEFSRLVSRSMISKFITAHMDPHDQDIFQDFDLKDRFIIDLEAIRVVKPFPGIHASGTKTLLKKVNGEYTAEAIWIDATTTMFTPEQGESWELAKYFVLQGCAIAATLVVHPLIHFPLDSVNAVTKTALPMWHPLFRLCWPHLRFTLPLENAVLNFGSSLLQSKWWMPYAPYPGYAGGLRDLLVEGFKGIKGNLSYPAYCYPQSPPPVLSTYGDFQDAYWPVFLEFARDWLKGVGHDDQLVMSWAKFLSQQIPGFPDDIAIMKDDVMVKTVASYLWQVSVGHSIDHYDYGNMDVRVVPLRLRQAPPKRDDKMISRKKLVRFWDSGKYRMARKLFFKSNTVTALIDAQYECKHPYEVEAVKKFKAGLKRVDAQMKTQGICYIPLEEIAASIQY